MRVGKCSFVNSQKYFLSIGSSLKLVQKVITLSNNNFLCSLYNGQFTVKWVSSSIEFIYEKSYQFLKQYLFKKLILFPKKHH